MNLIDKILLVPSYGWNDRSGAFIKPSKREIFSEFFSRFNFFQTKKSWLPWTCWGSVLLTLPAIFLFVTSYFSWAYAVIGFVYGMVVMGSHGTVWYHRYCTHKAYVFKNKFWRIFTRNLAPTMIPEEIYVISHHVHHVKSDKPGDPYNTKGGWLYCFLADVNHQLIARDMSEKEYEQASRMLKHTGVKINTYAQYKKWGSISDPLTTFLQMVLSILFWFSFFYSIGGMPLATGLLSGSCLWAVGVRTFNYDGHGRGKDRRKDGTDYNRKDLSINQYWPGFVAGEWHNNHHLYPASARSGFLKHQLDLAWVYIYTVHKLGGITSYHDSKAQFFADYLKPH